EGVLRRLPRLLRGLGTSFRGQRPGLPASVQGRAGAAPDRASRRLLPRPLVGNTSRGSGHPVTGASRGPSSSGVGRQGPGCATKVEIVLLGGKVQTGVRLIPAPDGPYRYAGGEKGHVRCRLHLLLGVRQETARHLLLSGVRPAVVLPRLLLPPRGQPRREATDGAGQASGRTLICPAGASPLTRISLPKADA